MKVGKLLAIVAILIIANSTKIFASSRKDFNKSKESFRVIINADAGGSSQDKNKSSNNAYRVSRPGSLQHRLKQSNPKQQPLTITSQQQKQPLQQKSVTITAPATKIEENSATINKAANIEAINKYLAEHNEIIKSSSIPNSSGKKKNNFADEISDSAAAASVAGAKNNIAMRTRSIRLGLASGESAIKYGLWSQIEAGSAKQKEVSDIASYKLTQSALSFGGDAEINDHMLFGLAYSRALSRSKDSLGNKSDHQAHIISVYNSIDLINHISITSILNFGIGKIKKTRSSGVTKAVIGNPKTQIFSASSEVEYLHKISLANNIIYSVGCDYDLVSVKSYQEKGDPRLVMRFGKKTKDNLQFIVGLMFQHIQNMGRGKTLTMEVHSKYNHSLSSGSKIAKVVHANSGQAMPLGSHKVNKSKIILGGGLNLIKDNKYEISTGYDFARGKAYNEHSGYLKLKVHF